MRSPCEFQVDSPDQRTLQGRGGLVHAVDEGCRLSAQVKECDLIGHLHLVSKEFSVPTIKTPDGVDIFYKDWGSGQPIVFSHGWPLSADDWDTQMLFFLHQGYRVIAHDRRGHGRSTQIANGHDMDHYADDLAQLTEHLDLKNAMHVGHSTGGGEVARYLARHGESRVAKAALISAVTPFMLKTETIRLACPKRSLMVCRHNLLPVVPSSIAICPRDLSMALTAKA